MAESHDGDIILKLHPPDDSHEVPASLLAKMLEGMQGLVYTLAYQQEGKSIKRRFKVSTEIGERYTLTCSPPGKGSFEIPTKIQSVNQDLFSTGQTKSLQHLLMNSLQALSNGDTAKFSKLIPDSRFRARAIASIREILPPSGSGFRFGIMNGNNIEIPIRVEDLGRFEKTDDQKEKKPDRETVTGRLSGISFDDRKVTIIFAPNQRMLECVYNEDAELMLFEKRRDLIQVTGLVRRDPEGNPEKIVEVETIEELDLSPMYLKEVTLPDGRVLLFKERISLTPVLSESEQLLSLEHESLQIDVFASTRDELWNELLEQVAMLWAEYAEEAEDQLTPRAQEFRKLLIASTEVHDGIKR